MFYDFRHKIGLENTWPIPLEHILSYIAYMYERNLTSSSISCYLSGIGYVCKLYQYEDITQKFIVKKVLEGVKRSRPQKRDTRLPITLNLLKLILSSLPSICTSSYETVLFRAAFSLSFHGLFRIGELAFSNGNRHTLPCQGVSFHGSDLIVTLPSSKNDQLGKGVAIVVKSQENKTVCPVVLLKEFMSMRPVCSGQLFCHYNTLPLTRYQFVSVLKKALVVHGIDPEQYSSHSFRIGAATYLSTQGVSEEHIMKLGRWKSNAYQRYIRK